ncbi:TetR/AcrR family transcriptional regulator [Anoxynatronum buryatiense]|uniref:Transcriptional regulator, TetR family n=1 Tax=Anoxynatronum buryatiense TaxID=489973 RepID=A0AA46AIS3_9CLOT|nr:TetR/AcrR family transcriptional regulator [Anoxynatronum buryatiense]SMP52236.1 transcriptional regulator, TetR family [Anoxynatronum buryatiense]
MATQWELKHKRLLEQAERLFFEKGLKAVTMEEIAAAAGISKMTIYNHFDSKEDLFKEITLEMVRRFNEEMSLELQRQPDTYSRLKAYFEKGFSVSKTVTPEFYQDLYDKPHLLLEIAAYKRETTVKLLTNILEQGKAAGEIQEADPAFVAMLLDVLTVGIMGLIKQGDFNHEELLDFNIKLFQFISRGVMADVRLPWEPSEAADQHQKKPGKSPDDSAGGSTVG